uniref:F-box associated beta-propeller type 3 domain-containing protein n=1 Tax=Fagus sylvatica TaxID=28930 RepID=A0A2N9HGV0_FAGSY
MNNTAFRDLHRTIDVSTYGKANIVVSSSPGRRGFRHPICAACQILNPIQISRIEMPFLHHCIAGFCNGMFCFANDKELDEIIYLWNPSIRKYKKLVATRLTHPHDGITVGLAYHSQNNDYKVLRIMSENFFPEDFPTGEKVKPAEAEVYTLSTDSWRKVIISVDSLSGSESHGRVDYIEERRSTFFNGALHSIAYSGNHKFILSFDVNDGRFREIMLPQNYSDEVFPYFQCLTVFKGSLALIVLEKYRKYNILWVMKEYGVVESWTKKSIPMEEVRQIFDYTINGELLIEKDLPGSQFDLTSLYQEILNVPMHKLIYTANLVESLVLFDGVNILSE